ncbi:MAG: hypothetical protein II321_03495, partial [Lachnospiraceae bacterium]|nr:hypothetical protein [Lachnospiraceae bacterium]
MKVMQKKQNTAGTLSLRSARSGTKWKDKKGENMANHKKKKKVEVAKEKAVFLDLFYMTPKEVTVKEMADFLKESGEVMVDFWEEMEVFEVGKSGL